MSDFKLFCCIDAHDNDVKSLCALSNTNEFISVSRDYSTRFWCEKDASYILNTKCTYHKSFITCVLYIQCSDYRFGLILSGGYDNVIKAYLPSGNKVEFELREHKGNITSLDYSEKYGLVSSSMDGTVILWNLKDQTITNVFKGHNHGVWKVIFLKNADSILTASADKTIFQWDMNTHQIVKKFTGHNDCVRSLAEIPSRNQFISCSNDGCVRLWDLKEGCCLTVYKMNNNSSFLYDVSVLPQRNSLRFVSCGESGKVIIWNIDTTTPLQIIDCGTHCDSIWCTDVLKNGDLITGGSDGCIRIYSEEKSRQIGTDIIKQRNKKENTETYDELPTVGIESLCTNGLYDGQIIKVDDEGVICIYCWNGSSLIWTKQSILPGKELTKDKKEYTFSIDVKDGEPPIPLHYRVGQDPWVVAKQFIDDNDLSPGFLDQLAKFIISNSKQDISVDGNMESPMIDPFTGGNRYIPGYSSNANVPESSSKSSLLNKSIPCANFSTYTNINVPGLCKKLNELSPKEIPEAVINSISNILIASDDDADVILQWIFDVFNSWNDDHLYPIIDVLRMIVNRSEDCNNVCFGNDELVNMIMLRARKGSHKGNVQTAMKFLCNSFTYTGGQILMYNMTDKLLETFLDIASKTTDQVVLGGVSSWLLNMAILVNRFEDNPPFNDDKERRSHIRNLFIDTSFKILEYVNKLDALNITNKNDILSSLLTALGTIVCRSDCFALRDSVTMGTHLRLSEIAKEIHKTTVDNTVMLQLCNDISDLTSTLDMNMLMK